MVHHVGMSQFAYIRPISVALLAAFGVQCAQAQGFFGGIKFSSPVTDAAAEGKTDAKPALFAPDKSKISDELALGLRVPAWERTRNMFATEQASVFGGVKTASGIGFGAALSQVRPTQGSIPGTAPVQSNPLPLGLFSNTFGQPLNPGSVGIDIYSSFDVSSKISLFGRLGLERNEVRPLQANEANLISPLAGATVRTGQSANYGVGIRFDVSPSLGVRAEYSRGLKVDRPEFSKETETDTLSLGLRWKF